MPKHVTKHSHEDGRELNPKIAWCGHEISNFEWHFSDAQHVALAVGGSISPCKKCIKAIIKQLEREL